MEEPNEADVLRLRKEDAVRQIIAGEYNQQHFADLFGISRQAVAQWVKRYKENGDLVPGHRGRRKLRPFSESEKLQFFAHVLGLYEKMGYGIGDKIPGGEVIMEDDLKGALKRICEMPTSVSRTLSLMRELGLPPYGRSRIIDSLYIDRKDWVNDEFLLRAPYSKEPPPRSYPPPGYEANPTKHGQPSKTGEANQAGELDEGDEKIPSSAEEYAAWHEETRTILAQRGIDYDPKKMRIEPPSGPGVRVGKHAKGGRHTPPKRRKKRAKKRR